MRALRRARRPLIALVALVAALAVGYGVRTWDDHGTVRPRPGGTVAMSELPPQVATTVHAIEHGGPFPYPDDDGVVFHNFEHQLPSEPDGFYHEYTVPTPNSADRGARRIVTGANGEFWYTADHYETFERLDVSG